MRVSTRIPTTARLRAQESAWIASCHPQWGLVLMEIAGREAAEAAAAMHADNPAPVAVFCGRGNNGGDGLVLARYLHMSGIPVYVYLIDPDGESRDERQESAVNLTILEKLAVKITRVGAADLPAVEQGISRSGLLIDALLGTGLSRPVEGVFKEVIKAMNDSGKPVLAIDIPSGINSDTGEIMGIAIAAHHTVSFAYLKAGLVTHPGARMCGRLQIVDIGLPEPAPSPVPAEETPTRWLSTATRLRAHLPSRPVDAHKGAFGHVLTIAGSQDMPGAALLSSKSALRSGAGLSILAAPHSLASVLPAEEITFKWLTETGAKTIAPAAAAELEADLKRADAVTLGPGLSQNEETVKFVHRLLQDIHNPCLIDADGLNAIAKDPSVLPDKAGNFVLTPHPKELSRLTGSTVQEIQGNRLAAAQAAAERFGCTVVLKGARTVIASQDGRAFINPTGNSAMATAGSGDVLSGIISGLMAQGMTPFEAAIAGAYVHGAAGDLASEEIGTTGIIAADIMDFIPVVLSQLRQGDYPGSQLEQEIFH